MEDQIALLGAVVLGDTQSRRASQSKSWEVHNRSR